MVARSIKCNRATFQVFLHLGYDFILALPASTSFNVRPKEGLVQFWKNRPRLHLNTHKLSRVARFAQSHYLGNAYVHHVSPRVNCPHCVFLFCFSCLVLKFSGIAPSVNSFRARGAQTHSQLFLGRHEISFQRTDSKQLLSRQLAGPMNCVFFGKRWPAMG